MVDKFQRTASAHNMILSTNVTWLTRTTMLAWNILETKQRIKFFCQFLKIHETGPLQFFGKLIHLCKLTRRRM